MNTPFALGSNGSGQLGIGHKEDVSVPKPVVFYPEPPASRIIKVAAGGNHTLLLTESGELYWSGDFAGGACGLVSTRLSAPAFRQAKLTKDGDIGHIVHIAATWEASIVVARDGNGKNTKIYSFGVGMKGELGAGELMVRTPSATQLKGFPPTGTEITDLSACMGHVVVVLDNGDAYGWGNCRKGQIGGAGAVLHEPRKVEGLDFKVERVVCCKEATCYFGSSDSGNVRVLGSDKWGLVAGCPSKAPVWKAVGASWGNIYILTAEGRLHGWGRDDHGQLPPPDLPPFKSFAAGSEHVVALSEGGDVLSWGWQEHGNCGPHADADKGYGIIASSKFIPKEAQIDTIGTGCATSWVCISGI
ncbi:hypothetical protein N3K66_008723 [Trichothecium roseum]|uniref:Uncharacterized protein n=1 Tax=Trichothecium roseum TaxID=47278 RepID=A0ACC0USC0_9HYPO|nr:hypothetical protein N3K66_008723 [Trichothecium roseum]